MVDSRLKNGMLNALMVIGYGGPVVKVPSAVTKLIKKERKSKMIFDHILHG